MAETSHIPKNKYRTTLYLDFGIVQKFKEKYPVSVSKIVNALLKAIIEGKSPLESLNIENLLANLGARGLEVMTSPLRGEDPRFESGRAHSNPLEIG